jgi:hypothetical protein
LRYLSDMSNIDEKTKIPLFAVLGSVPVVIGAVLWLTSIDAKATQAHEEMVGLKALTIDIRERQIRMEQMFKDYTKGERK